MSAFGQVGTKIIVHGRVQGVAFRAFTRRVARELELRGWTRNLPDGTVEVQAWGSQQQLEQLRSRLRKGPIAARVDHLEEEALESGSPGDGFEIVFT